MSDLRTFNLFQRSIILLLCLNLLACSGPAPKTQYFSLFSSGEAKGKFELIDKTQTFGVGPLVLPEFIDQKALVNITHHQQVKVSGRYAWAGDLKTAIRRVLADELSGYWGLAGVWAFPWDNRNRPQYQIRLVFERFSGTRAGSVEAQVKWELTMDRGKRVLLRDKIELAVQSAEASPESYVAALNQLLLQIAHHIAESVFMHLQKAELAYPFSTDPRCALVWSCFGEKGGGKIII